MSYSVHNMHIIIYYRVACFIIILGIDRNKCSFYVTTYTLRYVGQVGFRESHDAPPRNIQHMCSKMRLLLRAVDSYYLDVILKRNLVYTALLYYR